MRKRRIVFLISFVISLGLMAPASGGSTKSTCPNGWEERLFLLAGGDEKDTNNNAWACAKDVNGGGNNGGGSNYKDDKRTTAI